MLIFMGCFVLYPIFYSLFLSFNEISFYAGKMKLDFVGLKNYLNIFKDDSFLKVLGNTLTFTVFRVAGSFIIGMVVAIVVAKAKGFQAKIFKTLFLVPWALSDVVNGLMWGWMYNSKYGVINEMLLRMGLIKEYVPWLMQSDTALYAIIFGDIWKTVPFVSLMLLAAMKNLSPDLYDAGKVDGANVVQQFRYITLPSIKPIIMIVFIIQTMWALKSFDFIWVLTQGGPVNSTTTLSIMAYKESFQYMKIGYGASISYLLTILTTIFIFIYIKVIGKNEVD